MVKKALVVKLVAKPGREEEVSEFLTGALPLAQDEGFMPVWFALRGAGSTFYIVDAFADDEGRQQHLDGSIAAALMAKAPDLLAEPPQIERVEVLAAKLPG